MRHVRRIYEKIQGSESRFGNRAKASSFDFCVTLMIDAGNTRKFVGRIAALVLLVLALVVTAVSLTGVLGAALADEPSGNPIGAVKVGPNTRYCFSFDALKSELEAQKNQTVTVEMYCDWGWDVMTSRLIIPENARVTINMDGHKMDRDLTSWGYWQDDGEVILVRSGAVLTINGQPGDRTYETTVYESLDARPVTRGGFPGGLITGGASTDGAGGIHVNKGATVTLNDVTIAGCRAQKGKAAKVGSVSCGYGGGLYLAGGEITVNLNNSTITGNYASVNGGGIYADNTGGNAVNLANSHIDANFASGDGGGVSFDGRKLALVGDAILGDDGTATGSTMSNNQCAEHGGGVMANAGGLTARQIVLENNRAAQGGAIYDAQDSATLDRLVIRGNTATSEGGGIFFYPFLHTTFGYTGDSSIKDCTITNNSAGTQGGGVYVNDYTNLNESRKRVFAGATVIADNANGNLVIECSEWRSKSESFSLSAGADVRISYLENGTKKRTWPLTDENCVQYIRSDQTGYQFLFDVKNRFINRISDADAPALPTIVSVSSADANDASKAGKDGSLAVAGKIGTVGAGGGSGGDYNFIRGFASHGGTDELSAFYYSDALFYPGPNAYNEHLATLSLTFSYCGGYMDAASPADENGNTYYNKHWGVRQFLADIGCPDQNIYVSDNMLVKPGTDSIGVSIGSKKLARADGAETGDILIPVAVRGFGYEAEWVSNVTIGYAGQMSPSKEAKGFSEAADQVYAEIVYYLKKYNLEDAYKAGKVKFWVTGFSRAGATANLVSKRLVDKIAADGCSSQVFGYTCEAPKGGTDDAEVAGNDYTCIHNILNKVDIVPYVAPGQMGFKRYGVDHYIPGTAAGAVKSTVKSVTQGGSGGPSKTTNYVDNDVTYTKTYAYETQEDLMRQHLLALKPGKAYYDYFTPMALDFVSTSGFLHTYYDGNSETNHIEDFVEDFIWLLVQKSNISRDKYAKNAYTLDGETYSSIQGAARDLMEIAKLSGGLDNVMSGAGSIKDEIPYVSIFTFFTGPAYISTADFSMAGLYLNVIGNWGKMSDKKKAIWTANLWSAFKKTGALDKLSVEDQAKFEAAFPTLLDVALTVVDSDYNYKPKDNQNNQWAKGSSNSMMYLITLVEYLDTILQCHDPNVCLAWAQSYDSWYAGEIDNFKLVQPASVAAPDAYGTVDGKQQKLAAGSDKANKLPGDQRIVLENEDIAGEAVYYDLYDVTSGNGKEKLATNQLYRGGVDLTLGEDVHERSFEIVAYDMSYSATSLQETYRVDLFDDKHKVIVRDLAKDGTRGASSSTTSDTSGLQGTAQGDGGHDLIPGTIAGARGFQGLGDATIADTDYRERTYTFAEGQKALVQADEPGSHYFKSWKVEVLDSSGAVVAEDVTDALLPTAKTSMSASFTMPKVDATYPAGYQLRFTAIYGTRISEMTANAVAPVKDQALPKTMAVAFDNGKSETYRISWLRQRGDDSGTAWIPASESVALPNAVYHAVVEVEQDRSADILFTSDAKVVIGGQSDKIESSGFKKDSTTGSVIFWVTFAKTEGDAPAPKPPALEFQIAKVDLNTEEPVPGVPTTRHLVDSNTTVTISAPYVPNMAFVGWDFGETGITAADGGETTPSEQILDVRIPDSLPDGATITAKYVPTLSKVEANLYDKDGNLFEPHAGLSVSDHAEAFFWVGEERYEINPQTLSISWSPDVPDGGRFAPLVSYTAKVTVNVTSAEGATPTISVRKQGESAYHDVGIRHVGADDFEALFNGSDQDVAVDFAERSVSRSFAASAYELGAIKQPDSISGVAHSDGWADWQIRAMLPSTTKILTKHGAEFDANIYWGVLYREGWQDSWSSMVWTAEGTVRLPDYVENPDKVNTFVKMTISVEDAGTAPAPTVSPDPGTYVYNQVATFGAVDQNETIYYTTDGSDPAKSDTRKAYDGEQIYVSRADANQYDEETGYRMFAIKAYTETAGKRPSDVAEFDYVFFDVFIPEGAQLEYTGTEQVGVEGSPFYTLEVLEGPAGARIDENGNAVATSPGVYKVKAHLDDPDDSWQTDARGGRSKDDQVIEFVIAGGQDDSFTIAVQADPSEGGQVTGGGTYGKDETVTVKATANDGWAFVEWERVGSESTTVVSRDTEYSFKAEGGSLLVANFSRILTVKWLDGDGTELASKTYLEGEAEPTYTGRQPTMARTQQYSYTFKGWDAGYESGTVKTYRAQFASTTNKYKVTFVDEDGTVLKAATEYPYGTDGADIIRPADPTKASTSDCSYTFAGWTPELAPVTEDVTYKATYAATPKYTVTFVNEDGTVLQTVKVLEGDLPKYTGNVPTKAATAESTYVFAGWSPELAPATEDATYTATYSTTENRYKVTFVDEDGKVLKPAAEYAYGTPADHIAQPPEPTKPETDDYAYKFAGWSPELASVTEGVTYKATYAATRKHAVTFVNKDSDDNVIWQKTIRVLEGELPVYTGETPQRDADDQFTYAFEGWTPSIARATADATYTASYAEEPILYTVSFVDDDGTVLQQDEYMYAIPAFCVIVPGDPEKPATDEYTYTFAGWKPTISIVYGDATYTATYEAHPVPGPDQASLTFDCGGGTLDGKTSLTIVADVGDVIIIPAAPSREGYEFKFWKGSEYYPGDKYTVEDDHTFTAVWEQKPTPKPDDPDEGTDPGGEVKPDDGTNPNGEVKPSDGSTSPDSSSTKPTSQQTSQKASSAKTGDAFSHAILAFLAALVALAAGVALAARHRERK